MKTLYFECAMGASGDMLSGALLELIPDNADFCKKLNDIGLEDMYFSAEKSIKCGIIGTKFKVSVNGEEEKSIDAPDHSHEHEHGHPHDSPHHHCHSHTHDDEHSHEHGHSHNREHSSFAGIKKRIAALKISEKIKADIEAVYALIAEAESRVHNTSIDKIHFHELGTADALADITAACMLIDMLAPEKIICSPVNTGSGRVHCAHGILPVPAPATAQLLREIPVYSNGIQGELCTPTGAALLAHFVQDFTNLPPMKVSAIGYGMGKKDFVQANCLRAFWGKTSNERQYCQNMHDFRTEEIAELSCNLDDMTPEDIGFVQEILFENGVLDVYTSPIGMKKSRPGVLLCCLCRLENVQKTLKLIFRHTSTLGIRQSLCQRYILERNESVKQTAYGPVRIKTAKTAGFAKTKAEYEDAAKIARTQGIPLSLVRRAAETEE